MKKPLKIAIISTVAVIGVSIICVFIYEPLLIPVAIASLFAKNYNDDRPFSKNGLFIYENDEQDEVDIDKIAFLIREYQEGQQYKVVFKSSKNVKYGMDLEITTGDYVADDYSLKFTKKQQSLYMAHHYTYLYFFALNIGDKEYSFRLEPMGEEHLYFAFFKPIGSYVLLSNELTMQEGGYDY